MKAKLFLAVFFILLSLNLRAQTDKIIARTGDKIISAEEFKLRYEMTPRINKQRMKGEEKDKQDYLYSVIAEKLWALAAEERGLTLSDIMKKTFPIIEKMYVRDALYRKEVLSKVKISGRELSNAKKRLGVTLKLKYLVSFDKNEIEELYNRLKKGKSFEEILSERNENALQKEFTEINFGDTDAEMENLLFNLKPGDFTPPLGQSGGWFIFKLYEIQKRDLTDEKKFRTVTSKARGILEQRATDSLTKNLMRKIFAGKKVNTNGYIFWKISDAVIDALYRNKSEYDIPDGKKVSLESKDYKYLFGRIGTDTLSMPFIRLGIKDISVEEFLRTFLFEGFYTNNLNPNVVRAKLNARVKRFIEHEILAAEAYKKGYDKLPDVKMNIEIWRDKYLADLFKSELLNGIKVSEDEAKEEFQKKRGGVIKQVNIVELLTDSLEVINRVFEEISKGKDLRPLAVKYTKRKWVKENNGEFGFFPVTAYGDIGKIAAGMKVGEIYGPIETGDGYSVFQLIAVKEDSSEHKDFDNVKGEFIKRLKAEKAGKLLIDKTVELANKYGVEINEEALRNLKIQNLQMLVYKYFGFGGRMQAFPLTPDYTDWVMPWKNNVDMP